MAVETPASLGYRWPAEWEPHAATWVSWPHNRNSWPDASEPVPEEFATFVRTLAQFEPVHINAGGAGVMAEAKRLVGSLPNVTLHDFPTNDAWCRDHGPTFLSSKVLPPALVDWEYNAWGGKYPPFDHDNLIPGRIAAFTGRKVFKAGIILEGGAIDGNGRGTILTTEMCLLNPNRNKDLDKAGTEKYLRDYLGAKKILWLNGGEIAGDDTDGHIDQLARFVDPHTIIAASCDDPADENFEPLRENLKQLREMTDQDGQPFKIVPLPMPPALFVDEQRLPAGYCNFLIANGVVIVPQFEVAEADQLALDVLRPLFPNRQVLGCPSRNLIWGLGSFHCLSQQEPLAEL
jgi:agmatine deiminase